MKALSVILLAGLTLWSCRDQGDSETPPVEYRLTVGDTTITIPNAAVVFAGAQFSVDAYFLREYQVARDSTWGHPGATFNGTLIDWKALAWSARKTFLVWPYDSYDVMTANLAQYFYAIGTYMEQFGYGWRDTFDPEANLNNPAVHIWLHPADSTLVPDNPATVQFDGTSHLVEQYRGLWSFE